MAETEPLKFDADGYPDCSSCYEALVAYRHLTTGKLYERDVERAMLEEWHRNGHPEVGADGGG